MTCVEICLVTAKSQDDNKLMNNHVNPDALYIMFTLSSTSQFHSVQWFTIYAGNNWVIGFYM